MRILPLHRDDPSDYSCVSYWVLGENNTAADRNTLIDTGSAAPDNLDFFKPQPAKYPRIPRNQLGKNIFILVPL